jgi:hypothetical protein
MELRTPSEVFRTVPIVVDQRLHVIVPLHDYGGWEVRVAQRVIGTPSIVNRGRSIESLEELPPVAMD